MGVRTCKSKPDTLRVPNRPPPAPPGPPVPPAPPVPPKDSWPAQTYSSLGYQSASEHNGGYGAASESCYSEGVQSVKSIPYSTKSLQPIGNLYCTGCCSSARSDYEYYSAAASECGRAVQSNYRAPSCRSVRNCACCDCQSRVKYTCSTVCGCSGCSEQLVPRCCHSICSRTNLDAVSRRGSPSLHTLNHSNHMHLISMSRSNLPAPPTIATKPPVIPLSKPPPPVPEPAAPAPQPLVVQERKNRPKLSISPMPFIGNKDNTIDEYRCESLAYKRHIEQHIERVFKYLSERQERAEECETAIRQGTFRPEEAALVRRMLAHKETRYLRSLRSRFSPRDFEELGVLGYGVIGWVTKVRRKQTGEVYAQKKLRKSKVYAQNHLAHVMAERDFLSEADNEWIVKLFCTFQDEKHLYFILEYIPGGDMMDLLMEKQVFPEHWAQFYIAEISLAVQFVHDMGFIHRDIKPDNILIDERGHIKLADFGLCTGFRWTHDAKYYTDDTVNNTHANGMNFHDDHPTITKALTQREMEYSQKRRSLSLVGSPNYIAPEVLLRNGTNQRLCDWWSVGVILYEMVCGYCPFIKLESLEEQKKREKREQAGLPIPPDLPDTPQDVQMRIVNWKNHLRFPDKSDPKSPPIYPEQHISDETKALILGWINDEPKRFCQRGIQDIKGHPFFKDINWRTIGTMSAPFVPVSRDNKHFETAGQPREMEHGTYGAHPGNVNGFTYHAFWSKHWNGARGLVVDHDLITH